MTVADRIGVMDRGRLMQVAPPAEIYERPNSRWVADFIGDVNLFEGALGDDGLSVEGTAFGRLRVAAKIDARTRPPFGWRCGRRKFASAASRRRTGPGQLRRRNGRRYRLSRRSVDLQAARRDGVQVRAAIANTGAGAAPRNRLW
jgi:ABC-type Fe3+/spermidine/putrescine transport system ATPase subunit